MKKSKLMTIAAIAGSVLLITSVASFAATGSGYQALKKSFKATALLNNATIQTEAQLKDNGKIIMSGSTMMMSSNMQSPNANHYSYNQVVIDGQTHISENSINERQMISRIDDEYTSYTLGPARQDEMMSYSEAFDENSSTMKFAELVVDTLVGDIKNQFVKDGDIISVNLESAQIPELARLGISAVFENVKSSAESDNMNEATSAVFKTIPQMETINVQAINFQSKIEDNILTDTDTHVVITGTDINGTFHEIEIDLTSKMSDIGSTVPKTVDTTGKDVKTTEPFDLEIMSDEIAIMYQNGADPVEIKAHIDQMHQEAGKSSDETNGNSAPGTEESSAADGTKGTNDSNAAGEAKEASDSNAASETKEASDSNAADETNEAGQTV